MPPYGNESPAQTKKIEKCVLGMKGKKNMRTGKPYTESERIAICKSSILKKVKSSMRDETIDRTTKSQDVELVFLAGEKPVKVELIDDTEESLSYKIKFELIDDDTYNGIFFSDNAITFMDREFKKNERLVAHGLDHAHRTLEQLGKVLSVDAVKDGTKTRAFAVSELFKETEVQKQAYILFKQGLLSYISGGWKGKIMYNEDKARYELVEPTLMEISSTPVPAKKDAKIKEILNSLNQSPILEEEIDMADEQPKIQPPTQGESGEGQKQLSLLEQKVATIEAKQNEQSAKVETASRDALIAKGVELGIAVEEFKDMNSTGIADALRLANKAVVVAMGKKDPTTSLGGMDIDTSKDGTPEMAETLLNTHFPHLSYDKTPKGGK